MVDQQTGALVYDPAVRIDEMDAQGVDVPIVCATPILFGYAHDSARTATWARRMNDLALAHCAHDPRRLKALAQVPLQDLDLACREASRGQGGWPCRRADRQPLGTEGSRRRPSGRLPDPLRPRRHRGAGPPWDMMTDGRMKKWMMPWLVAMPAETQLGILPLILSGAFERIPASLKLCFAHGGGSFAFLLGRVENAWHCRDIVREDCPRPPSSYISRFHVDSAVFDARALRLPPDRGADPGCHGLRGRRRFVMLAQEDATCRRDTCSTGPRTSLAI